VWSVLPGLRPYMALRASGGILLVLSFVLFTVNAFATVWRRLPTGAPALAEERPSTQESARGQEVLP
jgi:cbb3-type cytochrome oxidase subunit 1